jgi:glycine cleavage system H lipoate-binding protein
LFFFLIFFSNCGDFLYWQVNTSPYDQGWLIKVKLDNKGETDKLMTPEKYKEFQSSH